MTLALYLSRQLAARILAVLTGIVALGLSLDMLENSTEILDKYGVGGLGWYAGLRAPLILATVLPLGVLVGAALAFLALALRNEMVVLRAAGYNTARVLVMLLPLALVCGLAQSHLAVRLGPAAELALVKRFPEMFNSKAIEKEVWLRDSRSVIRVGRTAADGATLVAVSIFETSAGGALTQRTDAKVARYTNDGWILEEATVQLPNEIVKLVAVMSWATQLTPSGILSAARRPELVDAGELRQILSGALPAGRGTPFYSVQLWRSYSAIVVPSVMFLFGAMASFGLSRSGGGIGRVALGLFGGAFFVLVDGVFTSLGEVGAMNAILAAFLAPGLFFVIGLWSIVVIEE
ncbi:MAG TPA: LptF/LptG family permease [Thermohalobaculum sp.]|nr:LptF/LptG family permease [Thermohalobaculum sp.]